MSRDTPAMPAAFGITGYKNAGKTTLVCRLVEELSARGWRVATVKFAHHPVEVDHEGRDSHRHRAAGARSVALISPYRWAVMHELDQQAGERPPPLQEVLPLLGAADVVLVEGRSAAIPKLEVLAANESRPLLAGEDTHVVAIATAHAIDYARLPVFRRDDIAAIADFIERFLELKRP